MLRRIDEYEGEDDDDTDISELDYSYYMSKCDTNLFETENNAALVDKYQSKIQGLNKIIKEYKKKTSLLEKQVAHLTHEMFYKKIEISQLQNEVKRLKNNTSPKDGCTECCEDAVECLCFPFYACQLAYMVGGIKLKNADK